MVLFPRFPRSRLDPNRDEDEAAQGHPDAVRAYRNYHNFVFQAKQAVGEQNWCNNLLGVVLSCPTIFSSLLGRAEFHWSCWRNPVCEDGGLPQDPEDVQRPPGLQQEGQ